MLRPLRDSDFEELFGVASDPMVWEQHPESERYKRKVFEKFFLGAMESGGAFVAIDLVESMIIGSSRYHGYNAPKSDIEIGWTFLARSHWGGKYNAEMKRLMLDYAFKFVDNVLFLIGPANIRSQRATERIGAVRDGSRTNSSGVESYVYRITKKT